MQGQLTQSFLHIAFFHILGTGVDDALMGSSGPAAPIGRSINQKAKSQEPKKNSVYVRKEFPETWLWTEEMVK